MSHCYLKDRTRCIYARPMYTMKGFRVIADGKDYPYLSSLNPGKLIPQGISKP